MRYYIPKGWHFSIPKLPILYTKSEFKWQVKFNNTCKYDIGRDQDDWNKLVGISNTLNPRKESVRFVWRYDLRFDMFEIGVYKEINNKWEVHKLTYVKNEATLNIKFNDDTVEMFGHDSGRNLNHAIIVLKFKKNKLTLRTNPYFGGNVPAPHCMNLNLTEL
jgi:hypothetical protein